MDSMSSAFTPTADQYFLLHFIVGTYFAPDLKGERPLKSALQRYTEVLPPYTHDQLAGSHLRATDIERVYYYVTRKVDKSLVVNLQCLSQFLRGSVLAPPEDLLEPFPLFHDLFPPMLHPMLRLENKYDILENIVLINNPDVSFIKPEHIGIFKRLTGLEDFALDLDDPLLQGIGSNEPFCNTTLAEAVEPENLFLSGQLLPFGGFSHTGMALDTDGPLHDMLPSNSVLSCAAQQLCNVTTKEVTETSTSDDCEPRMIYLPSCPSRDDWNKILGATNGGILMSGSAATGQVGPILGLMDIGECHDSYLFRVSLPGVKRDEKEFSCEVEGDGKVLIKGVSATDEGTVQRYTQVFMIQSQNLCPPGDFSISFQLPGPVNPLEFSGVFGTDGIFEGVVMKM